MDRRRISCIATPSELEFEQIRRKAIRHLENGGAEARMPHANQIWMLVGFELFRLLGREYRCIEVFPQAIVRRLGAGGHHKTTRTGIRERLGSQPPGFLLGGLRKASR